MAGTAAAICAAREGIDTLIVEAGEVEGGAQILRCMDIPAANSEGSTLVAQDELTEDQDRRFFLEIRPEMAVSGIRAEGGFWQVEADHGGQAHGCSGRGPGGSWDWVREEAVWALAACSGWRSERSPSATLSTHCSP